MRCKHATQGNCFTTAVILKPCFEVYNSYTSYSTLAKIPLQIVSFATNCLQNMDRNSMNPENDWRISITLRERRLEQMIAELGRRIGKDPIVLCKLICILIRLQYNRTYSTLKYALNKYKVMNTFGRHQMTRIGIHNY